MSDTFNKFAKAVFANPQFRPPIYTRLLALDPGETTGWSFFVNGSASNIPSAVDPTGHLNTEAPAPALPQSSEPGWRLEVCGQIKTWPIESAFPSITSLLETYHPDQVVYERYNVYGWKAADHSWSDVPTLQVIGIIRTLALQSKIPTDEQTAQIAKAFCKDDKLRSWGMYAKGQRHSRDSMRHGTYHILFGNRLSKDKT